jgi:hypothetical protein
MPRRSPAQGKEACPMRNPVAWLATFSVLAIIGLATWSLTRGQAPTGGSPPAHPTAPGNADQKAPPSTPKLAGPADTETLDPKADATPGADKKPHDPEEPNPLLEQIRLTAHRGADWLFRMNGVDGHFATGQIPALNASMEGDHFLRQAGAALALARAARMTGDQDYADRATHSILVLLGDTVVDPKDKTLRFTALPSAVVNRAAGAGLLVQAIHELPAPKQDVLDAAEQLCNFIRKQQRGDGSICLSDSIEDSKKAEEGDDASPYPGYALAGLMRSQHRRPADWKKDVVRKALAYYAPVLKSQKNPETAAAHAAAYAEAYLLTKEPGFANCVFVLNDWVCDLQYERLDARHPDWWGGFMGWQDGKAVAAAPTAEGAVLAEALAEGCRAAMQAGDGQRGQRYRGALELHLQYLNRLQYTQANTRHFAEWYRPKVLGGFHVSSLDGNLRLDDSRHAVCALSQYVLTVAK